MELILQGKDSTTCGQCCLAMITDQTLETIIDEIIGNEDAMDLEKFTSAFHEMGIDYKVKFYPEYQGFRDKFEGRGILRIAMADNRYGIGHAVAFEDGKIYDPMNSPIFDNIFALCDAYLETSGEVWIVDFSMKIVDGESGEDE